MTWWTYNQLPLTYLFTNTLGDTDFRVIDIIELCWGK